jgi:predicted nuclease with TOPRIM domain
LGALTVAILAVSPACKKVGENKEIKDLSAKAEQLDELSRKANTATADQTHKLQAAGVNDVKPDATTLQLTDDQKKALEERIKAEKNSSYQALLQEVLDKDKELKELHTKIETLQHQLPPFDTVKETDNHYALCLKFLRKRGVSEEKAKVLISKVLIMDKLAPGFKVYHLYHDGVYGTFVTQGKADITPTELQTQEKAKIEGERDTAVAQGAQLKEELADLNAQKAKITEEVAALQTEKTNMIKEMEGLSATNEAQKAKLNSLHYLVGERKDLETKGIIIVPVFAKDRAGSNWADSVFTQALDLRTQDTIVITATQVGLKKIGKVSVIPGSLEKDKQYSITIENDKATIKLLKKDRFLNEKVVFAVTD